MKICKFLIATLLIFAITLTTGCEGEDTTTSAVELNVSVTDLPEEVTYDGTTLRFEGGGQTVGFSVDFEGTGAWFVLLPTNDNWLTFVRVGTHVRVTVARNYSGMSRSSRVNFAYGDKVKHIEIVQDYLRLITFPEGDELNVSANRADVTFAIRTNVSQENLSVKVTEPENAYWINPIVVNSDKVSLTVARNPSPIDARWAIVTVFGEGTSSSFMVIQEPMSVTDLLEGN